MPVSAVEGKRVTTIEGLARRQAHQCAAGLDREPRSAVRLLLGGIDHGRHGGGQREASAHRRRHQRRHNQHLPLRHLPAGARSDARRSGYEDKRPETRAMQDDELANPGMLAVMEGEALWRRHERNAGNHLAASVISPGPSDGLSAFPAGMAGRRVAAAPPAQLPGPESEPKRRLTARRRWSSSSFPDVARRRHAAGIPGGQALTWCAGAAGIARSGAER